MMSLPDQLDVISCQMSAEIIHCLIVLAFTAVTVMLLLGPMSIVIRKMTDFLSRVRKSGRSWILVVPLVIALVRMGVTKETWGRVTFPRTDIEQWYMQDAGSYVTNGLVHVAYVKSIIVPVSADVQGWMRPTGSTNDAEWVRFVHTTFDLFPSPQDIPVENARDYDYQFFTTWSPAPSAHTNGVAEVGWRRPMSEVGFSGRIVPWRTGIYINGDRSYPNPAITNGPPLRTLTTTTQQEDNQ